MRKSLNSPITSLAFFDVDETIIRNKSMFVFMQYFLEKKKIFNFSNYRDFHREIQDMSKKGIRREDINSFYYSQFSGLSQSDVRQAARRLVQDKSYEYIGPVVEKIKWHKEKGHIVIAVSGAMRDIIEPILSDLKVDDYLCSEPGVENGVYNGNLYRQSIGIGKADAVTHYCNTYDYDPKNCYAYGDHISDVPFIEIVGHGSVVNPDKELLTIAIKNNWSIIEG